MSVDAKEVIVDLLARGHSVRFRASGDSMQPIIRSDDYLLVEPISDIRRGDVVLMLAERGLTAHRVLRVDGDTVITRGDSGIADDPPLERSRILGRVTHAERDGKVRRIVRATSVVLRIQRAWLMWRRASARRVTG